MKRDQESAEDYGYDLAHEDTGRGRPGDDATGHPSSQAPQSAPPGGSEDDGPAEDLGYDEAHDF